MVLWLLSLIVRALRLLHPHVIDTVTLYPHPKGAPWKRSLKDLARTLLGQAIQQGHGTVGHDSIQVGREGDRDHLQPRHRRGGEREGWLTNGGWCL